MSFYQTALGCPGFGRLPHGQPSPAAEIKLPPCEAPRGCLGGKKKLVIGIRAGCSAPVHTRELRQDLGTPVHMYRLVASTWYASGASGPVTRSRNRPRGRPRESEAGLSRAGRLPSGGRFMMYLYIAGAITLTCWESREGGGWRKRPHVHAGRSSRRTGGMSYVGTIVVGREWHGGGAGCLHAASPALCS